MSLNRLKERVWVFPYEEERDRPNLCYIRGDKWSMAVDAGHSRAHTELFYRAIQDAGLPLPRLTVITHWHWDHTLGMHAAHGLCLANEKTNAHLNDLRQKIEKEGPADFLSWHETIRKEYEGGGPVVVTLADITYKGEIRLDLGNCPVRVFQAPSPHTDDSTLIFAEKENILFLGDADGGVFPTGEKDAALARQLADLIGRLNPEICMVGHWTPLTARETVDDLLNG